MGKGEVNIISDSVNDWNDWILQDNGTAPSAPSLDVIERPSSTVPDTPDGPVYQEQQQKCWFSLLMNHCLRFIDKNASAVLGSEVPLPFHYHWFFFQNSNLMKWNTKRLSIVVLRFRGHSKISMWTYSLFNLLNVGPPFGLDEIIF